MPTYSPTLSPYKPTVKPGTFKPTLSYILQVPTTKSPLPTGQEAPPSLAAITTMVGLPLLTGMLSALGVGPVVVIAVAWLLPLGALMVMPVAGG